VIILDYNFVFWNIHLVTIMGDNIVQANFAQLAPILRALVLKMEGLSKAHSRAYVTVSPHKLGKSAFTSAATIQSLGFSLSIPEI